MLPYFSHRSHSTFCCPCQGCAKQQIVLCSSSRILMYPLSDPYVVFQRLVFVGVTSLSLLLFHLSYLQRRFSTSFWIWTFLNRALISSTDLILHF